MPEAANRQPFLGGLVLAIRFLTQLPCPGRESTRIADSQPWFPLVGLLVGLLAAAAGGLVCRGAPGWSQGAALAAVAVSAWVTRGFHLDGLSDCADGFGGGFTRERTLEIMKDPRVGAFGVIVLVIVLLAKWVACARLFGHGAWVWLPVAGTVSRTCQVTLAWRFPYARPGGGTGGAFVNGATWRNAATAIAAALALLGLLAFAAPGGLRGPAAWQFPGVLIAAGLGAHLLGLWFRRRVGGITGDLLGAANECVETAVLLAGAGWGVRGL
jgi:adenosylcobinamide-GDP ribazoletransferase